MPDPSPSLTNIYAAATIGRCKRDGLLWQDTAKTVPAVAHNDPVRVVTAPINGGGAVDFVAPSSGARPLLKNAFGNVWYLLFDGIDDCLDFAGVAPIPLSIHFAIRWVGASGGGGVVISGPTNSQKLKGRDGSFFRGGKNNVSNWTGNTATLPVDGDYICGLNYAATGDAYNWKDGVKDTLAQANVNTVGLTGNITRIGMNTAGGEPWNGRIYGWVICTGSQLDSEIPVTHAYLQSAVAGMDTANWPAQNDVRAGTTYNNGAYTGTILLPSINKVEYGTSYGAGGTEFSGTVTLPSEGRVIDGTRYGADDVEFVGTSVLPDPGSVLLGTGYGSNSEEFTGTFIIPATGDVRAGVHYGASGGYVGSLLLPLVTDVRVGIPYGASGTELVGTYIASGVLIPDVNIASAADVVRYLLITKGYGSDPDASPVRSWPIYVASEPDGEDVQDDVITIYDTTGKLGPRNSPEGTRSSHPGIQVRVRASTHPIGFAKARAIATALDKECTQQSIDVGADTYIVNAVTRTTEVIPLGKDATTGKRSVFTLNGLVSYRQL
jgi:hypothetical protein